MKPLKRYRAGKNKRNTIAARIRSVLIAKDEIVFAFLHGSFLSEPSFQDIDVAVFLRNINSSEFIDYESDLSMKIEDTIDLPCPVEVKVQNSAPLSFCFHVLRGRLLFTKDNETLDDYMVKTARKYLDTAVIRHHYLKVAML